MSSYDIYSDTKRFWTQNSSENNQVTTADTEEERPHENVKTVFMAHGR